MRLDYAKALAFHHGNREQLAASIEASLAKYKAIANPSPGIIDRIADYKQALEKCKEQRAEINPVT